MKWRIELPGDGNGSPIVVGGRVLVTCAHDWGRERTLHCYSRANGEELWRRTVSVEQVELTHKSNPYCGTTPASDGKVVVVWHGTGGLHCYDLDGDLLWSRSFGEIRHIWGYGTSPVIHRDRVILHSGATPNILIAAVRLGDGELLWKTEEPGGQSNETPDGDLTGSWCTPLVAAVNGKEQVICGLPTRAVALDACDGAVVWSCEGLGNERGKLVYASPLFGDGAAVFMGGYMAPTLAVRADGTGDVTATHRLWRATNPAPQRIGSGVLWNGFIYIANADGGTIECLDAQTGQQRWRERVRGGPHWASMVMANGLLFATNQSGITRTFPPSPDRFELLSENSLDETVNATPAISAGEILIRSERRLYCIGRSD